MNLVATPDETGNTSESGSLHLVMPLPGDESTSFSVYATMVDADVALVTVVADITVQWVPFGPDGDNSLLYEFTCTQSENEVNNTAGQANSVAAGCVLGDLTFDGDVDFFMIGVPSGQSLRAETKSQDGAGCDGDSILKLYDSAAVQIGEDDDGGKASCSLLLSGPISPGVYYVSVSSFSSSSSFPYRLELSFGGAKTDDPARDPTDKN